MCKGTVTTQQKIGERPLFSVFSRVRQHLLVANFSHKLAHTLHSCCEESFDFFWNVFRCNDIKLQSQKQRSQISTKKTQHFRRDFRFCRLRQQQKLWKIHRSPQSCSCEELASELKEGPDKEKIKSYQCSQSFQSHDFSRSGKVLVILSLILSLC